VGKLVATVKHTASITYGIYVAMTVAVFLLLLCGDMTVYEALLHAFGVGGTGGFGCMNDSLASYSPYVQWVVTVFMFLFGLNYSLFYLILIGRARQALRSEELWWYVGLVVVCGAAITGDLLAVYDRFGDALRHAFFQVTAILSTTCFVTADFYLWPNFSRTLLFLLMFVGGCAGSTAGGLKVSRLMILIKSSFREIRYLLHPRAVTAVHFEGKPLDNETIRSSLSYFIIFTITAAVSVILFSISDGFGTEASLSAVVSSLNNIGPALSDTLGPVGNYSSVTVFGKLLLALNMLLGRLEIFPILILFFPSVWKSR
jgi:trk system potassium uptake protein TrkH